MATYVLKRKILADLEFTGAVNGFQVTGDAAKGVGGFVKNAGLSMVSPLSVGGMVADNAKEKVTDALKDAANTAKNYTPTVQNAYLQKSYGAVQAIKEVGTGLGKGAWDLAKNNTKLLRDAGLFGVGMTGGGYALNRYNRQKAEVDSGSQDYKNGTSGKEKLGYGLAALGAGAGGAYIAAKGHESKLEALDKVSKGEGNIWNLAKKAGVTDVVKDAEGNVKDWSKETGTTNEILKKRANQLKKNAASEAERLKGNKVLFGKNLGISNKAWKMGRNAAIAGGVVAGAGMLSSHLLKKRTENLNNRSNSPSNPTQKNNSDLSNLTQKQFGYWGVVGRMAKKAGGISNDKGLWSGIGDLISGGRYKDAGKAVGTALGRGAQQVGKTITNFASVGTGNEAFNTITRNLRKQGEYGKKAADFLNRHKTTAKITAGLGLGGAMFDVATRVGEKPTKALTNLDKNTNKFVEAKEQGISYQPNIKPNNPINPINK